MLSMNKVLNTYIQTLQIILYVKKNAYTKHDEENKKADFQGKRLIDEQLRAISMQIDTMIAIPYN